MSTTTSTTNPADHESRSLTDPALYDDPWAFYRWLRTEHPVWLDETTGLYAVSRHADVLTVSRDTEHFSAAQGVRPLNLVPLSIISLDDPEHAQQRRVVARGFTPRQVRAMTDHVRELTNSVIDDVEAAGSIDFVDGLAMHVPLMVISELLGLDPAIRRDLYEWSEALVGGEGVESPDVPEVLEAAEAFVAYTTLITEQIELRRRDPRDDLLTVLTVAFDEGELAYEEELKAQYEGGSPTPLTDDELLMFCVLLMVAGNETTRNAIAGGLRAFSLFPEERAKLLADPGLIDLAVDEIIRWTSPVLNFVRTVVAPVTLGGVDLVPGDRVLMLYQSANRDEAVFDDPDTLRVGRDPNPHVAFGFGPHFCLGASLARMEVKVVFEELFRRLPDIALVDPTALPERNASSFVAAVRTMPAHFTPVTR